MDSSHSAVYYGNGRLWSHEEPRERRRRSLSPSRGVSFVSFQVGNNSMHSRSAWCCTCGWGWRGWHPVLRRRGHEGSAEGCG